MIIINTTIPLKQEVSSSTLSKEKRKSQEEDKVNVGSTTQRLKPTDIQKTKPVAKKPMTQSPIKSKTVFPAPKACSVQRLKDETRRRQPMVLHNHYDALQAIC